MDLSINNQSKIGIFFQHKREAFLKITAYILFSWLIAGVIFSFLPFDWGDSVLSFTPLANIFFVSGIIFLILFFYFVYSTKKNKIAGKIVELGAGIQAVTLAWSLYLFLSLSAVNFLASNSEYSFYFDKYNKLISYIFVFIGLIGLLLVRFLLEKQKKYRYPEKIKKSFDFGIGWLLASNLFSIISYYGFLFVFGLAYENNWGNLFFYLGWFALYVIIAIFALILMRFLSKFKFISIGVFFFLALRLLIPGSCSIYSLVGG